MRTVPRTRHYLSPGALTLCRPIFSFDYSREAYILRGIGGHVGPVVREDRRRRSTSRYKGPERRGASLADEAQLKRVAASAASDRPASRAATTRAPVGRTAATEGAPERDATQAAPKRAATPNSSRSKPGTTRSKAAGTTRPKAAGGTRSKSAPRSPDSKIDPA